MSWIQRKQQENRDRRDSAQRQEQDEQRRSIIAQAKQLTSSDSKPKFATATGAKAGQVNSERVRVEAVLSINRGPADVPTDALEPIIRHYENKGAVDLCTLRPHTDEVTELVLKGTMAFVNAMTELVDAVNMMQSEQQP